MLIANGPDDSARGSQQRRTTEAVNASLVLGHYRPTSTPALAIGTTKSKVTLGANVNFMLNGSFFVKNAAADVWSLGTATSATTVAVNSTQRYVLTLDASGNPFTYEAVQVIGTDATLLRWTNIAGVGRWRPLLYVASLGQTLIGSVQVQTDATHTFIPGTTLFDAAGLTVAYTSGIDPTFIPLIGNSSGQTIGSF